MPLFPNFRRPCPYQANLAAVMEGDWCRMCKQQVHDITEWSEPDKAALLARCATEEVCVSYRVPITSALAAATLAASPALAAQAKHHAAAAKISPAPVMITLGGAPMPMPPRDTATTSSNDPSTKGKADVADAR